MAPTTKRYKSAPITEAVIEIRIQPSDAVDSTALETLAKSFNSDFPHQTPTHALNLDFSDAVKRNISESFLGMRLSNPNGSRVMHLRPEGFAYSHLAPYSDWETFSREAKPLWDRYRQLAPNAKLARCALRYINRIDIPAPKLEPSDYFSLYIQIPKLLPEQDVINMSLNILMPQKDLECAANIHHALIEPIAPRSLSFVLDIDIFRLQIDGWSDDRVWKFLDRLRDRKNEIFEGCITDNTRELIDT